MNLINSLLVLDYFLFHSTVINTFTLSAISVHRVLRLVHWDIFLLGVCFRPWMLVMVATEWCRSLSSGTLGSVIILFAAIKKKMVSSEFITTVIIHQVFSLAHDWSDTRYRRQNIPQLKLVYPGDLPQFSKLENIWRIINIIHLAREYARPCAWTSSVPQSS